MKESANGQKGFLVQIDGKFHFRVYSSDKKSYKDYEIRVDDLEVQIMSNYYTLVDKGCGSRYIQYSVFDD